MCFGGFYGEFISFGFYNLNCIGHTKNSQGQKRSSQLDMGKGDARCGGPEEQHGLVSWEGPN